MKAYVGQTRSKRLITTFVGLGYGECSQPSEVPPRRFPWFLDNGAFAAFKAGRQFDQDIFVEAVNTVSSWEGASRPDFVVLPDIVQGGQRSFDLSLSWVQPLSGFCPLYLAVQDGMNAHEVLCFGLPRVDGLFVGGSPEWKFRTAAIWTKLAHGQAKPCHVGRVSGVANLKLCRRIGVDSIDSCVPLFSTENLARFRRGLEEPLNEDQLCRGTTRGSRKGLGQFGRAVQLAVVRSTPQ